MTDFERLARTLQDIFAGTALPRIREVRQILAVARALSGDPIETAAADFKLQRRGVENFVDRVRSAGLAGLASCTEQPTREALTTRRQGIARMLLGALAERRFEELIDRVTGGGLLRIEDHRPSRTDTDYRLLNGNHNPICRFNVKFHGSLFREARRYVGLDPEDCFALAAYKINNALRRQQEEKLPYIFLVLSVPDLSAADVGRPISMSMSGHLQSSKARWRSRRRSSPDSFAPTICPGSGRSSSGCPRASSA